MSIHKSRFSVLIHAQGMMDKGMKNSHLFPASIRAIHCDSRMIIPKIRLEKQAYRLFAVIHISENNLGKIADLKTTYNLLPYFTFSFCNDYVALFTMFNTVSWKYVYNIYDCIPRICRQPRFAQKSSVLQEVQTIVSG